MKVDETQKSTASNSEIQMKQEPFFSKEGEGGFFSKSSKSQSPFFNPATIQPKLTIGKPNDKYEVEADTMADKVVQRLSNPSIINRTTPHTSNRTSIQTKCSECGEEEKLQKKDDEVSESVVELQRKPIFESNAEDPENNLQTKSLSGSIVQTKCSSCQEKEKLQKKEEDASEFEENIQAKSEISQSEPPPDLQSRLNSNKDGGSPLSSDMQSSMGSAFGADFSSVRIHTGGEAVQMNKQLNAQAFTHGSDIYFNQGKYDTNSSSGKHLLAHELTHTIQQGKVLNRKIIQKNQGKEKVKYAYRGVKVPVSKMMGRKEFIVHYLMAEYEYSKEEAKEVFAREPERFVGPWVITKEDLERTYVIVKKGVPVTELIEKTESKTISEPRLPNGRREGYAARKKEFDGLSSKEKERINKEANRRYWDRTKTEKGEKIKKGEVGNSEVWLDIRDEVIAQQSFIKNLPEKAKKFFRGDKGGVKITAQDYEQVTRIANRILLSLTDKEVDEYMAANPKPAESLDQFEKAIEAFIKLKRAIKDDPKGKGDDPGGPKTDDDDPKGKGDDPGSKTDDDNKGKGKGDDNGEEDDEKKKSGSKYGVGLWDLGLPQEIIDVLEGALELLGDEEEMMAISETLRSLKDLSKHLDTIKLWFEDPSKLIPVVLGLQSGDNSAIEAVEKWVNKPAKKKKPKSKKGKNRLVKLAKKLISLVEKLRKILKPIFMVRGDFVNVFASVAGLIQAVPMSSFLMEKIEKGESLEETLVRDFTDGLISRVQIELDGIRKMFALTPESFDDTDFVSYEDLAGAITHAVINNIKHPVVKAASYIPGLEEAIADNVVAKLIPKSTLDAINGAIKDIVGPNVAAVSTAVGSDLGKLLDEVEQPLTTSLKDEIPKLIQKDSEEKHHTQDTNIAKGAAENHVNKSQGKPLPASTREQMETSFQQDFSKVRIHDNPESHQASESLRANAFTMGNDVFFGEDKFRPEQKDGQRLIAHELTHTVQQSNGYQAGVVQRDYKEYLDSLKGLLSKNVLAGLKPGKAPDPKVQKEAERIADVIQKVAGGKGNKGKGVKIKKKGNSFTFQYKSTIEKGYEFYKKKKGIPTRVRRRRKYSNLLPALTIKKGRIKLRALEKPGSLNDAARSALRRSLIMAGQCTKASTKQAHHVVPLELRNMNIITIAEKNGWKFNGVDNGVCLGKSVHSGSHSKYTKAVREDILTIQRKLKKANKKLDWANIKGPLTKLLSGLKSDLKKRRKKLK